MKNLFVAISIAMLGVVGAQSLDASKFQKGTKVESADEMTKFCVINIDEDKYLDRQLAIQKYCVDNNTIVNIVDESGQTSGANLNKACKCYIVKEPGDQARYVGEEVK